MVQLPVQHVAVEALNQALLVALLSTHLYIPCPYLGVCVPNNSACRPASYNSNRLDILFQISFAFQAPGIISGYCEKRKGAAQSFISCCITPVNLQLGAL